MATKPTNTQPQIVPPSRDQSGRNPASDSREALQALLAFSTLHDQIRQRRADDAQRRAAGFSPIDNAWATDQFMLDEVLQLVAERAQSITGSEGIAIALAEGEEIICRASVGSMAPDRGMRLDPRSGFSGACMRARRIIRCDDSENDPRVDVIACRTLGTRSMVAVPLLGHDSVIGLLEAFSTEPFGFSDNDVRSLSLLAELILAALKPEDEERIVRAAKVAAAEFDVADIEDLRRVPVAPQEIVPPSPATDAPSNQAASAPASLSAAEVPFELSKEDIAPPLFEGSTPATWRQKAFLAVALVLAVLGLGGLWWKVRSNRNLPAAAAATPAVAAGPKPLTATNKTSLPTTSSAVETQDEPAAPPQPALAEGETPAVTGIRHWTQNGVTTVAIDLQSEVQYETHRLDNPDRIYFDLLDTALAPSLNAKSIEVGDGLLEKIRVAQPLDGMTRVVLDTRGISDFSVRMEQSPYRLMIEVRARSAKAATPLLTTPAPAQAVPAQSVPVQSAPARPKPQTAPQGPALPQTKSAAPTTAAAKPAPGVAFPSTATSVSANPNVSTSANPVPAKPATATLASNIPAPAIPQAKPLPVPTSSSPQPETRAQTGRLRIVIDAGHGGWDLGTVGRHGLLEKDLVLDVAQRLGALVESRLGGEVIFTRRDDNYLSLEQRAELANHEQADLFVSVHANYSDLASARGVETYYSSFFLPPEAREAELRGGPKAQPVSQAKLSTAELKEKVTGSRKLAADVQHALYDSLGANNSGIRNRGVREASYVVLTGTEMPSILAEISFVSSPADEERLKSEAYRQQIAEALYTGIAQYHASRHPLKIASAAGHQSGQ
jgi:N-acetylmuramoyl-L-alanine amidase